MDSGLETIIEAVRPSTPSKRGAGRLRTDGWCVYEKGIPKHGIRVFKVQFFLTFIENFHKIMILLNGRAGKERLRVKFRRLQGSFGFLIPSFRRFFYGS
jgi:hypothetical protein